MDLDDVAAMADEALLVGTGRAHRATPAQRARLPGPPRRVADPMGLVLRGPPAAAILALRGLVTGSLLPLALTSASAWAGERALAAALAAPNSLAGHVLPERIKDNTQCLLALQGLHAWIGGQRALLRQWRAQLASGVPQAGAAAAWSLLRGVEGPMDAVTRMLSFTVAAGEGDSRRIRSEALARAGGHGLTRAQQVWFAELDAGIGDTLRWVAHAQAAATPLRVATFDSYLEASDLVVDLSHSYIAAAIAGFQRRRQWMTDMACPPPETLSAAASEGNCPGLNAAAQELAALPPGIVSGA